MPTDTIDEKTKVPLGFAASVVVALCSVYAGIAVEHYRVSQLEDFKAAHLVEHVQQASTAQSHELKIQKLELTLSNIENSLIKIDTRLERMEENSRRGGK